MYCAISPLVLCNHYGGEFDIFVRQAGRFVLYTRQGSKLSLEKRKELFEAGHDFVYVSHSQKQYFDKYVERNLLDLLEDENIPVSARSQIFHEHSSTKMKTFLKDKSSINKQLVLNVEKLVKASFKLLANPASLKTIASLMNHDYDTYSHSLQVYIYAMSLFRFVQAHKSFSEQEQIQLGVGALLHDLGKLSIPSQIITKPGKLDETEWALMKNHPLHGLHLARELPITNLAIQTIVSHHEKMDGSGYPLGVKGDEIPIFVRCVTIADIYDAITSKRSYADAEAPMKALQIMYDHMLKGLDKGLFKAFVLMLKGDASFKPGS